MLIITFLNEVYCIWVKEEAQNDFRNLVKMMRDMNLSSREIAQKSNKSEEEIREL